MPNGIIDIEDFESNKDTDWKLNVLFKTIVVYMNRIDARFEAGNERFKKLENRKLVNKVYATAGGIIGGALAAIGIRLGEGK